MLYFQHAAALWLALPVALMIGFFSRRSTLWGKRKAVLVGISLGCSGLLVLALSSPFIVIAPAESTDVFLIDLSDSMTQTNLEDVVRRISEQSAALPHSVNQRVVVFARHPTEIPVLPDQLTLDILETWREPATWGSRSDPEHLFDRTDIESALLFAQALVKQQGRIHLFTDGRETRGQARRIVPQLAAQEIDLQPFLVGINPVQEVLLRDIDVPSEVRQGQPASMQARIEATYASQAQVTTMNLQNRLEMHTPCALKLGENRVPLPIESHHGPSVSYRVTVTADQDGCQENNFRQVVIPIHDKPKVGILGTGSRPSHRTLRQWLSANAKLAEITEPAELDDKDLLILADTSGELMTPSLLEGIEKRLGEGMGMLVFPAAAMGAGAVAAQADIGRFLPVVPYRTGKKSNPNTTVVFIIDTSASMKGTRILLAKEIARLTIGHLQSHDKLGIVEFYGNRRWAAPIQSAANRLDINRALNRLTAGGGTIILPALEEAHYAMLNASSTTKHIVVISDGGVESADYEAMLRTIADDNIAVSTILIGPATHTGFMSELSQWGQGCFFHVRDCFGLPDLNFKSLKNKSDAPWQTHSGPIAAPIPSRVVAGLDLEALSEPVDYVSSQPRLGSQVLLELDRGQPLIARWNHGPGRVAFCSAAPWRDNSRGILENRAWTTLLANLCRSLYQSRRSRWTLDCRQINEEIEVNLQAHDRQTKTALASLELTLDGPEHLVVPLVQTRFDRWQATLKDLPPGIYSASAQNPQGLVLVVSPLAVDSGREINSLAPSHELVHCLDSIRTEKYPAPSPRPDRTLDLGPYCLLAAMVLLLAHVVIRRLPAGSVPVGSGAWRTAMAGLVLSLAAAGACAAETPNPRPTVLEWIQTRLEADPRATPLPEPAVADLDRAMLSMLCGDFPQAAAQYAELEDSGYRSGMWRGYCHYRLGDLHKAYHAFSEAEPRARTDADRKYALAWIVLMAEKTGRLPEITGRLLAAQPLAPLHATTLMQIYSLQGDLPGALNLRRHLDRLPDSSGQLRKSLEREITNLATLSGRLDQAKSLYELEARSRPGMDVQIGLVKLHLINGERDRAGQLLQAALDETGGGEALLELSRHADQMAFYDLADAAAQKAMDGSETVAHQAGLFRVQLARKRSLPEKAVELLESMRTLPTLDDRQRFEIAQVYEQMGRFTQAMDRYREIWQRTGASDVLMRIAWLQEKNQAHNQAYATWLNLWQHCHEQHLLYQIQPRLLDLAARTGQLAHLAVTLEESLEATGAKEKELQLLIDIYVSIGDSISAVELAKYHYGRENARSLQHQHRIYLRCHEYGHCNRVLRKLLQVDPDNSTDYLQQLAIIALERGNQRDAMAAVAAIEAAQKTGKVGGEYAAGILTILQKHDLAMKAYDGLLQTDTESAELWLLWANAANQAGRQKYAMDQISGLLGDSISDDLLTVAVDSLLNLEADESHLKMALARTFHRLARSPDKVFLYRLATDLLAELSCPVDPRDLLLMGSVVAPNRRIAYLREAQRMPAGINADRQSDLGALLIIMDCKLPPQAFIALGKQFLEHGRENIAQYLFHRNGLLNDNPTLCLEIADHYDRYGDFAQAARLVREALCRAPDNLSLLSRSASYDEILGDTDRAFGQYRRLHALSMGALSLEEIAAPALESGNQRKRQINAGQRYAAIAMHGLLSTATGSSLAALRSEWGERIAASMQMHNRLTPLVRQEWRHYDILCLAGGDLDRADRMARQILDVCAQDLIFRRDLVNQRTDWGFFPAARAWARDLDPEQWPQALSAWADQQSAASQADDLIRALILGRNSEARGMLERIPAPYPARAEPRDKDRLFLALLGGAALLDDVDCRRRIVTHQLEDILTRPAKTQRYALQKAIHAAWIVFAPEDRLWLAAKLENALAGRADLVHLVEMAGIHSGLDAGYSEAVWRRGLKEKKFKRRDLIEALHYSKPELRRAILRTAVQAEPDGRRKLFLWDLLGELDYSLTAPEVEAFTELFQAQPPASITDRNASYWRLGRQLQRPAADSALVLKLAENLLTDLPDHPPVKALVAVARAHAGRSESATILAQSVIENWREEGTTGDGNLEMLKTLISVLPMPAIEATLADLQTLQDVPGWTPRGRLLEALVQQRRGHMAEARTAMNDCFSVLPDNRDVFREIQSLYRGTGHLDEFSDLIAARLHSAGQAASSRWRILCELYYQRGRHSQALQAAARDSIAVMRNRSFLFLHQRAGNHQILTRYLRKYQLDCRLDNRFYSIIWPEWDRPGGLLGFEAGQRSAGRQWLYATLGHEPTLIGVYQRYWYSLASGRKDMQDMAEGLARLYAAAGRADAVLAEIGRRKKANVSQVPKDRALQLHLALHAPVETEPIIQTLSATDLDSWRKIGASCQARGEDGKAGRIFHYLCLTRMLQSAVGQLREDLNAWRQSTGAAWPKPERLRIPGDSPFVVFNARDAAWHLDYLLHTHPEIDLQTDLRALEKRFETPLRSSSPALRFALMKAYLRYDDPERFDTHLRAVLLDQKSTFDPPYIMDFTALATVCAHRDRLSRYLNRIRATMEKLVGQRRINGLAAVPHLAALAVAFHDHDDTLAAEAILRKIAELIPEPSHSALWLIDAMDRCGQSDQAVAWRETLSENGLLPACRTE